MTARRSRAWHKRVWMSSPGNTPRRHQLAVVQDGLRVTRTLTFPEQPEREPKVQTYDAPDDERAHIMFGAWSSITPEGYRLIASTEAEDDVEV